MKNARKFMQKTRKIMNMSQTFVTNFTINHEECKETHEEHKEAHEEHKEAHAECKEAHENTIVFRTVNRL